MVFDLLRQLNHMEGILQIKNEQPLTLDQFHEKKYFVDYPQFFFFPLHFETLF